MNHSTAARIVYNILAEKKVNGIWGEIIEEGIYAKYVM